MGWFKKKKTEEDAWFEAIQSGDTGALGQYNKSWLEARNRQGDDCVHVAAIYGHTNVLRMFIDSNHVSASTRNTQNQTPLILAAKNGRLDALRYLLTKDSKATACDVNNHDALYYAVKKGYASCVHALLKEKTNLDREKLLLVAIENRHPDIAIALIQEGAKTDIHAGDYGYAIHKAIEAGLSDVVKALIKAGADLTARDSCSNTPLHTAVLEEEFEILEILLNAGAPLHIEDDEGQTPVQFAKSENKPLLVKRLKAAEKAAPPAATAPAPAPPVKGQESEEWVLMGKDKIAQVGTYPALGRQITEIFNFTSMDRRVITTNLTLKTETIAPAESLDTLSDDMLQSVYARFKKMGGKAEEAAVFQNRMMKKRLGGGIQP